MAVYLKHFTNIWETICGAVFLANIKNIYIYILLRTFENFFDFFRAASLTRLGDSLRRTKSLQEAAVRRCSLQ